jgi:hypothetical protein
VAEIRVARAAGDDEGVVREDVRCRDAEYRTKVHLPRLQIEVRDLGHLHTNVRVPLEDRPQRIGDLAR